MNSRSSSSPAIQQLFSPAQKHKLSHQKDIYLILRSIYFLKVCQSAQRITKQVYERQIKTLIERYNLLVELTTSYTIKQFAQELSVPEQEITFALKEIQSQKNKTTTCNSNNQRFLFVEITSIFIEALDFEEKNVGRVRLLFEKFVSRLDAVSKILKSPEFILKIDGLKILIKQYIDTRPIDEQITQTQLEEIKLKTSAIFDLFGHLTKQQQTNNQL